MNLIDYPQDASEEIDFVDGQLATPMFIVEHRMPIRNNPELWGLKPYDKMVDIEVDRVRDHVILTLRREVCALKVYDEGTLHEAVEWTVTRHTTRHYLTMDEMLVAQSLIDQHRQTGTRVTIKPMQQMIVSMGNVLPFY
jgi:hypothetical protein